MRKILLTTFGSYGDLHPYIAMAKVLLAAGNQVTIATHQQYQEQVERIGAGFVAVKPGLDDIGPQETWAARANNRFFGTEFIVRTLIMPFLEEGYHAIHSAAKDHDLIISHILCFPTPLVAEKLQIPWIGTALQPSVFFSAYDPPAIAFMTFIPHLRFLGPRFMTWFLRTLASPTRRWLTPIDDLRQRLGLRKVKTNALTEWFSPHGNLALFSKAFAPPQPDWPVNVAEVGFPLFDEETSGDLSDETIAFLDRGPAPVVFTLGTAIVMMESAYFEIAYQAVKTLGLRAMFLVGKNPTRIPPAATTDPAIHIAAYEPFSKLFPRANVIVHQCGVGTTAQALASGRPQVPVPFAHDQPDNARRIVAMGCGRTIPAHRLTVNRLISALKSVTDDPSYGTKAREAGQQIHNEEFSERLLRAIDDFLVPADTMASSNPDSI